MWRNTIFVNDITKTKLHVEEMKFKEDQLHFCLESLI
jgi:hypothetical protein